MITKSVSPELRGSGVRALALARNPHLEIYEGLIEFLKVVVGTGLSVDLVCPHDRRPEDALWAHPQVTYSFVPRPMRRVRAPTTARLFSRALTLNRRGKPRLVIGLDPWGGILAGALSALSRKSSVLFGLELPHRRSNAMRWQARLEHWSLRQADLIVTFDKHHVDFLSKELGIAKERCVCLPNAMGGTPPGSRDARFRSRHKIDERDVLVLHAGGIGAAQQSIEVAKAASAWPERTHLVFQCHYRMDNEEYYQRFLGEIRECRNVHLEQDPVGRDELDGVVGAADIGLAWYDRELLGYRADLLGLAPGKIGRYLRNGVPVVARDLPTIRAYLDGYDCGISVGRVGDIQHAVEALMEDHSRYSRNAQTCFEELWRPEHYLGDIRDRLIRLVNGKNRLVGKGV